MADGFDDNDLRLLSLRAKSLKDALSALNQPPPFNEPRLRAYLDLLEASEEPKDVQLVLEAIVSAHQSVRQAYGQNIGADKAPQATAVHTELAALRTELGDIVSGFIDRLPPAELPGPTVDAAAHEPALEPMRQAEHDLQKAVKEAQQELVATPFRQAVTGGVLSTMVDPLVALAYLALFILARLSQGQLGQQALESLLARQDEQVSAFEQAVERNREAVESVNGLYNRTKAVAASARSKITTVRRGVARIFRQAEPSPGTRFPDASPEAVRDLPPGNTPPPPLDLPPPDCTTDDGKPGYLLAGTCYPLDTKDLRPDGEKHIDFAKLAAFRQLVSVDLRHTQVKNLAPLARLTSLKLLWLNYTPVSDLTPITGLTSLQGLTLNNTQVSDLTPVAGLTSLQRLDLDHTQVSDLTPVAGLISLQTLWLNNTQVNDLTPVAGLTSLQTLYLNNTQVSDLTPLKRLEKLRLLVLPDGRDMGGFDNKNRREVQEFLATL